MLVDLLRGGTFTLEGDVIDSYIDESIGGLVIVISTGLKLTLPITDDNLNKFIYLRSI